jgi:hypothetical protein
MTPISGGCLCGKVRYTVTAEPLLRAVCHCRDCQRFTGSGFVAIMQVPRDSVRIEGELRGIDLPGGSGKTIRRLFCPNCGSSLFAEPFLRPGRINVMAGTLDDPKAFTPTTEIFCVHAFPWLRDQASRTQLPQGFAS